MQMTRKKDTSKSINLDITFCRASMCPKELKDSCERCLLRVSEYMEAVKCETLCKPLSIADFSKDLDTLPKGALHNESTRCDMFKESRWS